MEDVQQFREEFTRVQQAFQVSLEREGDFFTVIRDLKLELVEKALQLQEVYHSKKEDEKALYDLRCEVSSLEVSRDTAMQREEMAKELMVQLQDEVFRLRAQVGELQATVAHLSDTEIEAVVRPPLLAGLQSTILGFSEWKQLNPQAYGAREGDCHSAPSSQSQAFLPMTAHGHGHRHNVSDHASDGRRPFTSPHTPAADPSVDDSPADLSSFFDAALGLTAPAPEGSSLPKQSVLTVGRDGKPLKAPAVSGRGAASGSGPSGSGSGSGGGTSAMSRADTSLAQRRLPRLPHA